MKKVLRSVSFLLAVMLLFGVAASAASTADIYDLRVVKSTFADCKVVPEAGNNDATPTTGYVNGATKMIFTGVDKFALTFTPSVANEQYMVFMLKKNGANTMPVEGNIYYINQEATSSQFDFNVYPSDLETGEYGIYVSSVGTGYKEVGSLAVAEAWEKAGFMLGNVNLDEQNDITLADAMLILNALVKNVTLNETQNSAADVNCDGSLSLSDAMSVLNYLVKNIVSF